MAVSTDITLPRLVTPEFPDSCIVCHESPDSSTKITKNSQHWIATFFMPILYLFGWSRTEIPICSVCKPRFYLQRWGRTAICWAIVVAVVLVAWPYFDDWGRLTKKIALVGLVIVAMAPYIALEILWPRSIDTTGEGGKVTYEFASSAYALQFYVLNRKHVVKSDIEFVRADENNPLD